MSTLTNAYALIIGIANYRAVNPLPATVLNDARGVYDLLVDPQRGGYDPANVQCLLDGKATLAALRAGLAELAQRCDSDSTAFVYFSGHGARLTSGPSAGEYLMPVDASMASTAALARHSHLGPGVHRGAASHPRAQGSRDLRLLPCWRYRPGQGRPGTGVEGRPVRKLL